MILRSDSRRRIIEIVPLFNLSPVFGELDQRFTVLLASFRGKHQTTVNDIRRTDEPPIVATNLSSVFDAYVDAKVSLGKTESFGCGV